MVYFLLGPDEAADIPAEPLEPPLLAPAQHLQMAAPAVSGLTPKSEKKQEMPGEGKMQAMKEAKDFNHCTSPVPASTITPLNPTLWLQELHDYKRSLPRCYGSTD